MTKLCKCGCGAATLPAKWTSKRNGTVRGIPTDYLKGHNRRASIAPVCGYVVDPSTGCWNWMLALDQKGYGKSSINGRSTHSHIAEWQRKHGPVPDGLELDHTCKNIKCCNPDHLEAVTPTENKRRSRATKLTHHEVVLILRSSESQTVLARRFGVSPSNICHIKRGDTWVDIERDL